MLQLIVTYKSANLIGLVASTVMPKHICFHSKI